MINQDLPVRFKDISPEGAHSYLFEGEGGEIFWFTMILDCLFVNLLPPDSILVEEPKEISSDCPLYEHMISNRFLDKGKNQHGNAIRFYNYTTATPRMFTIDGRRIIAFSHHDKDCAKVLFYDIDQCQVTVCV